MSNRLEQLLAERPFLIADGATGTNLFAMGLMSGDAPELWNFEHPERIEALHQGWIDAGSDIILTNTFGGTSYRLKLHKAHDQVHEINREAARIARRVADRAGRPVIVAGSIGPSGELFEPLGALTPETAALEFARQAKGLAEGGVDMLWIETMSAREEIAAAPAAAVATPTRRSRNVATRLSGGRAREISALQFQRGFEIGNTVEDQIGVEGQCLAGADAGQNANGKSSASGTRHIQIVGRVTHHGHGFGRQGDGAAEALHHPRPRLVAESGIVAADEIHQPAHAE